MIFFLSMILTSFIGFFICYRGKTNLTSTERLFIPIFVGWGYFSNLINLFSINFPDVELSGNILFGLIITSLVVFTIPFILIDRRNLIPTIKTIFEVKKEVTLKLSTLTIYGLRSRRYLIIPTIFLALVLFNILITYYYEISIVDPIFQWVQRGELIFLEKSVSAANNHPFGYYPKHVSILYAWAYFFGFDAVRIFYLIALFGFAFITLEIIYIYSRSIYASLVFTTMIVFAQYFYTYSCFPEGISNIYFFLAVLYSLKYLEQQKITFILLASFFMTMFSNTRGEGILYLGLLLIFIMLINILSKKFKLIHVFYWILPLFLFYYIPKVIFYATNGGVNLIMNAKIIIKAFVIFFENFGEIYLNKQVVPGYTSLMAAYHANKITCMILSFFAFWDSLFFDPDKKHFYNVMRLSFGLIKHNWTELYLLLLLILFKTNRSLIMIIKFIMFIVFPFVCFIIVMNFLQIYFYYSPQLLEVIVHTGVLRYGGFSLICLIFFLSANDYTWKIFKNIEDNSRLGYILNIPFLYLIFLGFR